MKSDGSVRPALPARQLTLSNAQKATKDVFKTVHVSTMVQP